ncbi:hypothetical protein GGI04_004059 [Coemansia thaxteri]|nr:hypothetical protein GGI04_004059 [Coemansia thaxteri]KAJ2484441.1 hypothetical protein EV174_002437 [Coemansia sp. RSA 2320]
MFDHIGERPADFDSVNVAVTIGSAYRAAMPVAAAKAAGSQQGSGPGSSAGGSVGNSSGGEAAEAGSGDSRGRRPSDEAAELEGGAVGEEGPGGGSSTPPTGLQTEPNPDVLRSLFIETCSDKNQLEMFWQQTISRYRGGWRGYRMGRAATSEQPKTRPMVIDTFSEGLWQQPWCGGGDQPQAGCSAPQS